MSDLSGNDLLQQVIYPNLFENLDSIYPEFGFRRNGNKWISTTKIKLSGDEGEPGKVCCYENNLYGLKDYRGDFITHWDRIQERDNLSTNGEVFARLAELAGVELQKKDYSENELKQIKANKRKAELLETANDFFIDCLSNKNNEHSNSKEAQANRDYLVNQRGYSNLDLSSLLGKSDNLSKPLIEVGYIPSVEALKDHLKAKRFFNDEIEEGIKFHPSIGNENSLSIPWRGPSGFIQGFAFRSIGDSKPKYLFSTGEWKSKHLFGQRKVFKDRDLVIVEGLFDCMHAQARGFDSVVALGGTSLNKNHIDSFLKQGIKKITLALDNDEAGEEATFKLIEKLGKHKEFRVYVVDYPKGIKDCDELLVEIGGEALTEIISKADSLGSYVGKKFSRLAQSRENITDKDRDDIIDQTASSVEILSNPQHLADFNREAKPGLDKLNIQQERFLSEVAKHRNRVEQERHAEAKKRLLNEIADTNDPNILPGLLGKLSNLDKSNNSNKTSNAEFFHLLDVCTSKKDMHKHFANKPKGLKTGIFINSEEILLDAGQLSAFAAATGHGKTRMLINLVLKACEEYPDEQFYFFTYEEDAHTIVSYFLNTYADLDLSSNNRRTLESYYGESTDKYFKQNKDEFKAKEKEFYETLIDSGRLNIVYVDYGVEQLTNAIQFIKDNTKVKGVFIDYLQLIKSSKFTNNSRQEELKHICMVLMDTAIKTGLPIIMNAQFNRQVTDSTKLHATNIGEAGDTERACCNIYGVWDNTHKPLGQVDFSPDSTIILEVLKGRKSGQGNKITLHFNGNTGKVYGNGPKELNSNEPFGDL